MYKKFIPNKAFLIGCLILVCLASSGCESSNMQKSAVNDYISSKVSDTLTAVEKKDVDLARDVWSDLSELSVELQNDENEDLSDAVATLALSYEKLVAYCNSGKTEDLDGFKKSFRTASEDLNKTLTAAGYDCTELEDSLKTVYM